MQENEDIKENNFQLKIFQEINKANEGKNIMVSPISIYHILSLTANGAANKTLTEMLQALCEKDLNALNKKNSIISNEFDKLQTIEFANAVFTRFNPLNEFQNMIKEYKAKLDILKDANQINQWCSEATHEKIPKIVNDINPNAKIMLINAIYFKGKWQKQFDQKITYLDTFYDSNNKISKIMFMHATKKYDYFENKGMQAISLNYKKDNLSALIILPKKGKNINDYIEYLTLDKYDNIISGLTNQEVNLSLPKFEFDFSTELIQNFKTLGMHDAFNAGAADFSVMKKEKDIYISNIIHKTYIKVDEEGTEAVAVTAVEGFFGSCFVDNKVMKVDHPFLFIIRSKDLPPGNDMIFIAKVESLK